MLSEAGDALPGWLLARRVVDAAGIDRARARRRVYGGGLDTALLELGLCDESTLRRGLEEASGLPAAEPAWLRETGRGAARFIDVAEARRLRAQPVAELRGRLEIVVGPDADLDAVTAWAEREHEAGCRFHLASEAAFESLLARIHATPLPARFRRLTARLDPGGVALAAAGTPAVRTVPPPVVETGPVPPEPPPEPVIDVVVDLGDFALTPVPVLARPKAPAPAKAPAPGKTPAPKPIAATKPAAAQKPGVATKPTEAQKPAAASKPTEATKPAAAMKPTEATKPTAATKPTEATKPAAAMKPAEAPKPAAAGKPAAGVRPPAAGATAAGKASGERPASVGSAPAPVATSAKAPVRVVKTPPPKALPTPLAATAEAPPPGSAASNKPAVPRPPVPRAPARGPDATTPRPSLSLHEAADEITAVSPAPLALLPQIERWRAQVAAGGDEVIEAIASLAELRDAEAVPELIARLEDRDAEVRTAAEAALRTLTAHDFGGSRWRWSFWWRSWGKRHRVEWLLEALSAADPERRLRAAQELERISGVYVGYHFDLSRPEREAARRRWERWWQESGKGQA